MNRVFQVMTFVLLALTGEAAEQGHLLFRVRQGTDVHGVAHQLGAQPDLKAIVLVFLGPECPISQRYIPELNRIHAESTNAVQFFGIISSPSITRTQAASFVDEYAIRFPVLCDEGGRFARWLHPTHVPEAFVIKPDGDTVYHGRIDDGYEAPGRVRAVVRNRELRDALHEVQAGRTPPKSFVRPVGCYFEEWPALPRPKP